MKGRRRERDSYADACRAMRWAFRLYADAEVRWRRSDTEVLHTVIGCTAGYSKVWDWVTLRVLAELSGHDRRTCQLSLHRLDEHNVISWEPGDGREWSRVALPTEGGRLAWTSEGRSHTTAPQSPAGAAKVVSRPAGATAPHASRGGDIRPPQGRLHSTAPLREGLSRSESSFEKEGASRATSSPSVEEESPTEEAGAARGVSAGPEGNPGTDAAADVAAAVELVADVLGDIGPKRKRMTEHRGEWFTLPDGTPVNADGTLVDPNPAPTGEEP